MNVLFITTFPPPITGQSLAVKVFYDELVKYHQVDVINLSKPEFKNGISSFKRITQIFKIFIEVFKKKQRADIIYFTISESIAGNFKDLIIYLLCFNKLTSTFIHLHGGAGMRKIMLKEKKLIRILNNFFISRLKGVIVLGRSHVDMFLKTVDPHKIFIVPNFSQDEYFIEDERFNRKYNELIKLRILFLSNLIPGKGYIELLDAYISLPSEIKEKISVDFAGGFESEASKRFFLDKIKGVTDIYYHGLVTGEVKKELLFNSHIFCLPTYYAYEGQPISILEAYASGNVVITTDHSGIKDIFQDNINGIKVEKKSSESLKFALLKAFELKGKFSSIGQTNRDEAVSKFRTSIYNETLLEVILGKKI